MKRIVPTLFAVLAVTVAVGCSGWDDAWLASKSVHSDPVKLAPYLYEMEYSQYSPEATLAIIEDTDQLTAGAACSVVRNGQTIGRNLDFFYDEMAEIIVRVPAASGRYASIGVSSCNPNLTANVIDSGQNTPYYEAVPYFVTDGVNEKGVYASINMAPTGDLGLTTGTNPGAETLCGPMVVRYVLDHCASAREACESLERMNIKASVTLGEFHYMIADQEHTYVVETIDNKLVYSDQAGNILTNYYLLHDGLTPHACGMEREAVLKEHYDEGTTVRGMSNLMMQVRYSQIYDRSVNPFWYSDFVGDVWKGVNITIDTPHSFYEEMIDEQIKTFQKHRRNYLDANWITVHTSIYDLKARSLRVFCQEDYLNYWEYRIGQ